MTSPLFRPQVLEHRADRLHGEVVLTQPLSTSVMVMVILGIVVAAILWLSLGTYARVETAPGVLVTGDASAKVVVPAPGIISDLRVREGSVVKKGDPIAVINVDRSTLAGDSAAASGLAANEAQRVLGREQIELAEKRAINEGVRLGEITRSAEAQSASLDRQIKLQQEIVASNRSLFAQIGTVVQRGFVSRVELERRRQTLLNAEQQLAELERLRTATGAEIAQASVQLAGLELEMKRQQSDIRSSMQALTQQRARLNAEQAYVVTAPVSGRVTALQAGNGRVASNQMPLMIIVPLDTELKAEIYAPSRAIGFVRSGQEARLLFDAFPYQRFGSFEGTIESVSSTILDPRENDAPIKLDEAAYKVTVRLSRQDVEAFGKHIPLQPGMMLTANIVLDRQSFLDWLLTPLNAVKNRVA